MQFTSILAALALGSAANAHMALQWPQPFRASYNPHSVPANIDYSLTSPLNADGSNFPCKGYQTDLGTPAGASVVTWNAGGAYNFSVEGGAVHGGGSCQIALSYDKGVSFSVIHSYVGSCPLSSGEDFQFTLPADAPTGAAMFAWVWYNEIGNREMYMDCASITVDAGKGPAPATKFADRPDLFVANLGNGCTTVEGKEVQFPNPGPDADVTTKDSVGDNSGSYTGTCAAVKGIGGSGSAPSGGSTGESTSPAATTTAEPTTPVATPTTVPTTLSTVAIASSSASVSVSASASPSPGVFATTKPNTTTSTTPTSTAPAVPVGTGSSGSGSSGSGSAMNAGTACSTEGMWNCVDGTSFQQCASGAWSVVQMLAAGTQCEPGQSSAINISAISSRQNLAKRRVRRALRDAAV
jgi:hypothetical protein